MTDPSIRDSRTVQHAAASLRSFLAQVPAALARIPDPQARPPGSSSWSHAEILGHLIDSALNNIQRFVRLQHVVQLSFPIYDPDQWVAAQFHDLRPWTDLISEWTVLNGRVLHLMEHIDPSVHEHVWTEGGPATLRFLMVDYLTHLEGHLNTLLPGIVSGPSASSAHRIQDRLPSRTMHGGCDPVQGMR